MADVKHNDSCLIMFTPDVVDNLNGKVLTGVYTLSSLFITLFNLAVIIGLLKTNKKLSRYYRLFLFLSTSDSLIGIVLMPFQIYLIQITGKITCTEAGVQAFWNVFPTTLAGMTVFAISMEQYLFTAQRHFYETHMTTGIFRLVPVIEILIAFLWSIWYAFVSQTQSHDQHASFLMSLAIFEGAVLSSVIAVNIKLVIHVRKQARTTQELFDIKTSYDVKTFKTIKTISTTLVISYLPSFIGLFAGSIFYLTTERSDRKVIHYIIPWGILPTDLNSGFNAVIFLWRNKKIVEFYKDIFRVKSQNISRNVQMNAINN